MGSWCLLQILIIPCEKRGVGLPCASPVQHFRCRPIPKRPWKARSKTQTNIEAQNMLCRPRKAKLHAAQRSATQRNAKRSKAKQRKRQERLGMYQGPEGSAPRDVRSTFGRRNVESNHVRGEERRGEHTKGEEKRGPDRIVRYRRGRRGSEKCASPSNKIISPPCWVTNADG